MPFNVGECLNKEFIGQPTGQSDILIMSGSLVVTSSIRIVCILLYHQ